MVGDFRPGPRSWASRLVTRSLRWCEIELVMIVTIDGPAGAGKSTVARRLAGRLGCQFLDTGAMYRGVVWSALSRGVAWSDIDQLERLAAELSIAFPDAAVWVNGEDVTEAIRSPQVTASVHFVADEPRVRARLVELQRRIAATGDYVTEGRDQGTVAFPDAHCKIFLTASPDERARRRVLELQAKGLAADFAAILAQQKDRDARDAARPVGALKKAPDAIELLTDQLSIDQVVTRLEQIVRVALSQRRSG